MYNDARGSGPFTTRPYLHLQWRLIALDWLDQSRSCFLPRIHWKKLHFLDTSRAPVVIKFVFLVPFFKHVFFYWMRIPRLIPGRCSPPQSSTMGSSMEKEIEAFLRCCGCCFCLKWRGWNTQCDSCKFLSSDTLENDELKMGYITV